jgi:hypothetical protein
MEVEAALIVACPPRTQPWAINARTRTEPRRPAGASVARSQRSERGYWPGWGRSLKIRMPRYLFIHACLWG